MQAITETIYMLLLDEGTTVWAPVQAERLSNGCFRIMGPRSDEQKWQFDPGCIVFVEERRFSGGERGLAAVAIAT